jgi:hypothetical protein
MPGGGSRKGERRGGRKPGTKNKATIERERVAMLAAEREKLLLEVRVALEKSEVAQDEVSGRKLMKEIGFDLAQQFAGLAAFYQPQWRVDPATGRTVNANPNFDEAKFRQYAELAATTARDFAAYESPKLSAVMVGSPAVTKIQIIGGIPDDQDGNLIDTPAVGPECAGTSTPNTVKASTEGGL